MRKFQTSRASLALRITRYPKTIFAVILVLATLITSFAPVATVEAKSKRRYLRDVYTSDEYYQDVRYCNEHYAFGEKLGRRDRLQPKKIITKGKAMDYVYNFYLPVISSIDSYGVRYDSRYDYGDEAWAWATSAGVVSSSEDYRDTATMTWFYNTMNHFAYYIDGGYMKFGHRRSSKLHKYDVCRVLYVTRKTKYNVDKLMDSYYNYDYNYSRSYSR